jgi:hypothetical protein
MMKNVNPKQKSEDRNVRRHAVGLYMAASFS